MAQKTGLKVLVIDDEPDVVNIIELNLKSAGFEVSKAHNGKEGLEKIRREMPHLIVLDLMLPGMSGMEVCEALKAEATTARIPVIMLTARAEEQDRIAGLELGADDYVSKPFSPRELVLRVEAVLKRMRTAGTEGRVLQAGKEEEKIRLDQNTREAWVGERQLVLTATEFRLLDILMERQGQVQERDVLLNDVWGYSSAVDTRTVDTHMRRLREKLGAAASCIETVRGAGYCLKG